MLGEKPQKQQKAPKLHLDVGFGDYLTKSLKIQKLQSIIVKEDLSWKVYPIETIISEKLEALIKRRTSTITQSSDSRGVWHEKTGFLIDCCWHGVLWLPKIYREQRVDARCFVRAALCCCLR